MSTKAIELQAVDTLADALATVDLSFYELSAPSVFTRQLAGTDPAPSIGIVLGTWSPVDTPQLGQYEPARGRYRIGVQTFIKSSERDLGIRISADFVKKIRHILYSDPALRSALGQLNETHESFGAIERGQRWGIETTTYHDLAISGGFAFLSQTDFFFETEVA